nr:MAG TPA: hypothetical protein [Caudoviricetes sp.]
MFSLLFFICSSYISIFSITCGLFIGESAIFSYFLNF